MTRQRCGGFKVFDYFYGLFHGTGFRCVNCGAITDIRARCLSPIRIVTPPSHAYRGRTTGKVSGRWSVEQVVNPVSVNNRLDTRKEGREE